MVYKGCVVKIEKDFAIVLTDQMEYLEIMKKDGLEVGKKVLFLEEDLCRKEVFSYRKIAAVAAIFLIMILSIPFLKTQIGNNISYGATAIVSLDINPSLEIQINKENKAIKIIFLNQDAKKLLMNKKLVGKPIEDVISIVINRAKEDKYLEKEKNAVLISTVVLKNNIKNEDIKKQIEKKLNEDENSQYIKTFYIEGKKEDLPYARKEKVSIGKYEVFEKIKEKNKKMSLESIKHMKVEEIIEKNPSALTKKEDKIIKKERTMDIKSNKKERIEIEKDKNIKDKIREEKEDKTKNFNKNIELKESENGKKVKKEEYIPLKNQDKEINEKKEKKNRKQEDNKGKGIKKKNKE